MDKKAFGRRLMNTRKERDMTIERLSEICEISPVFLSNIERAHKLPSLTTLIVLCNALQVDPANLLSDSLTYPLSPDKDLDGLFKMICKLTPNQRNVVRATVTALQDNDNVDH